MLNTEDQDLVAAARATITKRYRAGWHVVGAALRTKTGKVFTGVHLEANIGRVAICAEAVALGRAATEAGDTEIDTIVAVWHPDSTIADRTIAIVAPCGLCREMISDYSPAARVIVSGAADDPVSLPVADLLPLKFSRP